MKRAAWAPVAVAAFFGLAGCATPPKPEAASILVPMALVTTAGPGAGIGAIRLSDGPTGVVLELDLHGLPPGDRGFHVHEVGSCDPAPNAQGVLAPAQAALGHLDPARTGKHEGPAGSGHLGDLPLIHVGPDGRANQTLSAPRLGPVASLRNRALMIHAGGDTYSDTPAPLGGGGARIACGIIK